MIIINAYKERLQDIETRYTAHTATDECRGTHKMAEMIKTSF